MWTVLKYFFPHIGDGCNTCHGIKSICMDATFSHVPAVSAEISSAVSTAVYGVLGFLLLVRFCLIIIISFALLLF